MNSILNAIQTDKRFALVTSLWVTILFSLLILPVLFLGFTYGDDYRLPILLHPNRVNPDYLKQTHSILLSTIGSIKYDLYLGRFRPLSWAIAGGLTSLFGENAFYFRLLNVCSLFYSGFLFIRILQHFQVSRATTILFVFVLSFGKNAETWWSLIPPAQNPGEILLLLGILQFLRFTKTTKYRYFYIGFTYLLLAACIKESFAILTPILLCFCLYITNSDSPLKCLFYPKNLVFVFLSIIPLGCLVFASLYNHQIYGYDSNILETTLFNCKEFLIASILGIPVILGCICIKDLRIEKKWLALAYLVTLSQLLLLVKIKSHEQHHYLFPFLYFSLIYLAVISDSLRINRKCLLINNLIIVLHILLNLKNTWVNSHYYAAKNRAHKEALTFLIKQRPKEIYYVNSNCLSNDWIVGNSSLLFQQQADIPFYHVPWMDCNTDKVSSFRRKSIDIIKGSKEGYLFFETPDEKKSCTFYTRESTDCVLVSSKSKTRKIKGKLYEFRQTYTSISMEKLLEGKIFTNESVTFKVIARK